MEDNKKDKLFGRIDLENLPEEERAEILTKAGQLIQKKILLRIEEEMSDEEKKKLEEFLEEEGEDPEKVENYLRENIPNLDEIIKEEIEETRKDILGQMEELGL